MRSRILVVAVGLTVAPTLAAGQATMTVGADTHEWYGDPVRVPLDDLARGLGPYKGKAVRTEGTVDPLGMSSYFYRLREGAAVLLLMPSEEGLPEGMDKLMGRRVEVVGVVRELPYQQGTCPMGNVEVPESKCADPLLPPLPDRRGHPDWPHNSLTWWYITDLTPDEREKGTRMSALEDLVLGSGEPDDETIEVVGQFRGANLFGDLPDGSQRKASDFVIRHGEAAAWVTGKKPKGKGWALDLNSRGDSRWWLHVKGRAERRNGVVYIRAKKVSLTTRPTAGEP